MDDKKIIAIASVFWLALISVLYYSLSTMWAASPSFAVAFMAFVVLPPIAFFLGNKYGWWKYTNRVGSYFSAFFNKPVNSTRGVFYVVIIACIWFGTVIAPADYDAVCEQLYETTAYSKGIANLSLCRFNQRPNSLLTFEDGEPVFTWQSDFDYGDFDNEFYMQNMIELDEQPAQRPAP